MIHLHTHSMYSLRDSIIKPEDLIIRLKETGQNTVAITDHGSSLGGVSLYKALKKENIKYIHGIEFYICDDVNVKDKNSKYYHLVALCKNDTGRKNMNRLISMSEHPGRKYFKPRIDFEMLSEYGDGLIILSACMAGEICRYLEAGEKEKAIQTAIKYKEKFGEDYYLEIQSHNDEKQIELNKQLALLSEELDIECVVTCDAHFVWEEDKRYQNRYAFYGSYKEEGEAYTDCFMQSEEDVRSRLTYFDKEFVDNLIRQTHIIAGRCNVEMPLSPPIMPHIDTPKEYTSNYDWLDAICKKGFQEKLQMDIETESNTPFILDYKKRYQYEMESLKEMGFIDYILLVYTYANVARRRGIARGSGGGSLVCFLANITNIDPIRHGLYFERFIDVGVLKLLEEGKITASELKIPDIDLDFSADSCLDVLQFLFKTYGEERVASIGRFGTNQTKGTVRDMCRVLDIDLKIATEIAKSFGDLELQDIDAMIHGDIETIHVAKDAIKNVKKYPELFDYVRKLNNLPKSFGLHPCGKVISTKDLDEFLPSCYDSEGIRYLQGDMHDVEDVGLVKIDVLGLRTIDQEYDTLELSKESEDFISPQQNYDDLKVLDIFRSGDTVGIFQMSSYGMRQTLKKMDVQGIEDLSVANALYRPGSLSYIDNFCRRRKGEEKFEYLHPDLEPILKNTYGIIVFQEQLIEIGRLAGIHNPDLLRKATGKKDPKLLAQVKPELEEELKARGWSEEQFSQLWMDMIEFSKYSFNKSHAAAYAIIAYMTAKQKAYYPAEFYAGLCNSYIGKSSFVKDEAEEIIQDMIRHEVTIQPFSFRNDHRKCTVQEGRLLYAIPLIKDCNAATGEVLYKLGQKNITTFWELLKELNNEKIDKAKIEILISLGFFHEFGNVKQLLKIFEMVHFFKFAERKSIRKAQIPEDDFLFPILNKYSVTENKKGVELKSYKISDINSILNEVEQYILSVPACDIPYKFLIEAQKEYLGFVMLITEEETDRPKLYIKEVTPLHRKKDNRQFGYSIIAQSIGSGIQTRYTVFNAVYNKYPVQENDIILCKGWRRDGQYFTLTNYQSVNK